MMTNLGDYSHYRYAFGNVTIRNDVGEEKLLTNHLGDSGIKKRPDTKRTQGMIPENKC